jgi:hypothetical protein
MCEIHVKIKMDLSYEAECYYVELKTNNDEMEVERVHYVNPMLPVNMIACVRYDDGKTVFKTYEGLLATQVAVLYEKEPKESFDVMLRPILDNCSYEKIRIK